MVLAHLAWMGGRGSLAFSNSSDAASDNTSAAGKAERAAYGLTMGEGGSGGIGRGVARRGGMALFETAPSEGSESRKAAAKSNVYSTMAFSDMEKENEVHICLAQVASNGLASSRQVSQQD